MSIVLSVFIIFFFFFLEYFPDTKNIREAMYLFTRERESIFRLVPLHFVIKRDEKFEKRNKERNDRGTVIRGKG